MRSDKLKQHIQKHKYSFSKLEPEWGKNFRETKEMLPKLEKRAHHEEMYCKSSCDGFDGNDQYIYNRDHQCDDVAYCKAEQKRKIRLLNRCKKDRCLVCYKYIRSDNIKRHIRTHKDILGKPEPEWRKVLRETTEMLSKLQELTYQMFNDMNDVKVNKEFKLSSYITVYHQYHKLWTPQIDEELACEHEAGNIYDEFAIAVIKDGMVVGHVPKTISEQFYNLLQNGGLIEVKVIGEPANTKKRGLRIPCMYIVNGQNDLIQNVKNNFVKIL